MSTDISCAEMIKKQYAKLSKSEKTIADYVLLNGHDIASLSLADVARGSGVSEPTVVRFTKDIGLDGFSDLKMHLMKDWGKESVKASPHGKLLDLHILPDDRIEDLPEKITNITIRSLQDTLKIFDTDAFLEAVNMIIKADRIDVFGVGTSSSIALDFVSKLIRIGLDARYFSDNHLEQISCLSLSENDVAIAISHSGSTIDVVDTLRLAKENGARTIALTNYKASIISEFADVELMSGDYETTFYSETMVSRTSLLALTDMLYMGIILSDFDLYTARLEKVNKQVECKNY